MGRHSPSLYVVDCPSRRAICWIVESKAVTAWERSRPFLPALQATFDNSSRLPFTPLRSREIETLVFRSAPEAEVFVVGGVWGALTSAEAALMAVLCPRLTLCRLRMNGWPSTMFGVWECEQIKSNHFCRPKSRRASRCSMVPCRSAAHRATPWPGPAGASRTASGAGQWEDSPFCDFVGRSSEEGQLMPSRLTFPQVFSAGGPVVFEVRSGPRAVFSFPLRPTSRAALLPGAS
jgi:hypothetical protein